MCMAGARFGYFAPVCETMMENDCVTGRVLSLHRILKQTVPRVHSSIVHGPLLRIQMSWK
jgi:hypothetical protein